MAANPTPPEKPRRRRRKVLWFEKIMAVLATINLVMVFFDLTYVPFRNFWLLGNIPIPFVGLKVPVPLPQPIESWCPPPGGNAPDRATLITQCYDWIKGIEPNRDTQAYLETVNAHQQLVRREGLRALNSPEVLRSMQELGELSDEMVTSNPFELVDKTGTLERIKNLMREHMQQRLRQLPPEARQDPFQPVPNLAPPTADADGGPQAPDPIGDAADVLDTRRRVSSREAFRVFWSPLNLTAETWEAEMEWFDKEIRPLIQTNYFRSISETGGFTNNFWVLDAPFVIIFLLEFLGRTFWVSRRYTGVSWIGAMTWRWYDIPLIFPFGVIFSNWAWIRILPVSVRLHQSRLVDMDKVVQQATQGFVGSIADEITQVVVVQVLDQVQGSIRRGDITQWLARSTSKQWVSVNEVNEVAEISSLLVKLTAYEVFPKVRPDLEVLIRHSIDTVLSQSPAFQALKQMPGMENLANQISERVVNETISVAYSGVTGALEDEEGAALMQQLVERFAETMGDEMRQQQVLEELQRLLTDLLEEVKLSYVQQAREVDSDAIMDETRKLRQLAQGR